MQPKTLTLPAFGKINLSLHVLGKRADRYHDLDTIVQTISLCDTIIFVSSDDREIVFSCDDRSLPTDEHNLVVRAAKLLQTRFGGGKGARIRLIKRIPTYAGLGGGSADAAMTLIGLAHICCLDVPLAELHQLASELGADVPFFLYGGTVRATGIGDRIERLPDYPPMHLLIVKPNANIQTADAYRTFDERCLTSTDSKIILHTSPQSEDRANQSLASLHNDFEPVAFALAPEIERAKAALIEAGSARAILAGSGSAVFGFFDSEDAQRRAIQAIELETGWRVFLCKTVGREEYQAAFGGLT